MLRRGALPAATVMTVVAALASPASQAQRQAVLKQIDVPHNYYFREMYLPQLTNGPSAVAFSPDGQTLVYSMQGSLWKQSIRSSTAEQLTAGPGYDYQPDWSPDGRHIAFVRYLDDALELAQLDVDTGAVTALTRNRAVNVEPRWSPDGSHLAWVSTAGTGHFHVFTAAIASSAGRGSSAGAGTAARTNGGSGVTSDPSAEVLQGAAVWPERRSRVARYYYSPFDHELSPTWSPDGKELIYVGNPESVYGTGGLWRRALTPNAEPTAVRLEETTWRARPAWSPDGKRVMYSSYAGRQWHQLWITTAAGGGDPIPLSYGEFDATNARWSPDGARIAFISNRNGSTEIWLQDVLGGAQRPLQIREKRYRQPMGELRLRTLDTANKPIAARIAIVASDGRAYGPDDAWMHADDGFDRRRSAFETHYFHTNGEARITLPAGTATITVWRGLEYQIEQRKVEITPRVMPLAAPRETRQAPSPERSENPSRDTRQVALRQAPQRETGQPSGRGVQDVEIRLRRLTLPPNWSQQWLSADVHVHMNYGGTYRNTPERLVGQADAEDLDVVFNLIVNKEQRIPDIGYFSPLPDKASTSAVLLSHGQEYHTSYWGHLGLLGLNDHFLISDYSAYANTAAASLYPTNGKVADLAHTQNALVGYVHPFDEMPDPAASAPLTNALPIDVALGKVDYYEVVGFSEHRTSAAVWYRLLNCGFRPAAAAGTDAMANYASLRGPVGMNRVYVRADRTDATRTGAADSPRSDIADITSARTANWIAGLRAGRTMATNGPLVGLAVNNQEPGSEIQVSAEGSELTYKGFLRSIVPIDHLEIVMNGTVVRAIRLDGNRTTANFEGKLKVTGNGWLLVRAWNDGASPEVFDLYPYATTNAVFFRTPGAVTHCGKDADYFVSWLDRLDAAASAHDGYNTAAEREATLAEIRSARKIMDARR